MTGERLGVIGTKESDSEGDFPQWKKDFLSKPSVSVRKGIAWVSLASGELWRVPALVPSFHCFYRLGPVQTLRNGPGSWWALF